jgi:hypothetical protein
LLNVTDVTRKHSSIFPINSLPGAQFGSHTWGGAKPSAAMFLRADADLGT